MRRLRTPSPAARRKARRAAVALDGRPPTVAQTYRSRRAQAAWPGRVPGLPRCSASANCERPPTPGKVRATARSPLRTCADPQTGVAPREDAGAAMCVRSVDDQCVLQFTLVHAAGCVLHRRTSRVIHRRELFSCYFYFRNDVRTSRLE